jgi:disulfide bond formation protein DsbB
MVHGEHLLCFPVIVLVALILIVLSFRMLFRLFVLFLFIIAIWYGLYFLGLSPPPIEKAKPDNTKLSEKKAYAHV